MPYMLYKLKSFIKIRQKVSPTWLNMRVIVTYFQSHRSVGTVVNVQERKSRISKPYHTTSKFRRNILLQLI